MGLFSKWGRSRDERAREQEEWNRRQQEYMSDANDYIMQMLEANAQSTPTGKFWSLYESSLELKDGCKLESALDERLRALTVAEDSGSWGLICMAYHNIAVLDIYHRGDGMQGMRNVAASLRYEDDYIAVSDANMDYIQFGAHLESLNMAILTANSYEEALDYATRGCERYPDFFTDIRDELIEHQKLEPRFGAHQVAVARTFYSRVSPELDKGDYSPAMALLEIALTFAERPEYDFTYEEYAGLLDDYATLAYMNIMKKRQIFLAQPDAGDYSITRELYFMKKRPVQLINEFLPDCQPADRELFETILKAFDSLPA